MKLKEIGIFIKELIKVLFWGFLVISFGWGFGRAVVEIVEGIVRYFSG